MFLVGVRAEGVDIWDYHSKRHLVSLTPQMPPGDSPSCYGGCISSDNHMLAMIVSRFCVAVWDIRDVLENNVCTEMYEFFTVPDHLQPVGDVVFSRNSEQLVVATGIQFCIYDALTGRRMRSVVGHTGQISFMHTFERGLLTASRDGSIKLWNVDYVQDRHLDLRSEIANGCVTLTEDTVAVTFSNKSFALVNLSTLEVMKIFSTSCRGFVYSPQFNVSGTRLFAKADQRVYVYDIASEALLFQCLPLGAACYNVDSTCIYGGNREDTLATWDAETGSRICPADGAYIAPSQGLYRTLFISSAPLVVLM
jgi:WD40 repeat protein